MTEADDSERSLGSGSYQASITKAHFLFHEMRVTASLLSQGSSVAEARARILKDNLYQYPTERSLNDVSGACCRRLLSMGSSELISAIATAPASVSKQVCLYAMMKQSRLVYEFMHSVIGEKYRTLNASFSRRDVNAFFERLQEQDAAVAQWRPSTLTKVKGVLIRILVECGYLEDNRAETLNIVTPVPLLEQVMRRRNERGALAAFNIFS